MRYIVAMAKKRKTKTVPYILNEFDLVDHLLDETDEQFNKSLLEMPFSLLIQNYGEYCEAIGQLVESRKSNPKDQRMDRLYNRKHKLLDELKRMMFDERENANRANYHYDKIADEMWALKNKKK